MSKQHMIRWTERHRRMRQQEQLAWEASGKTPQDPGLRDHYEKVPRARIRLITCPLNKDVNHGGLLRLAEAFRLEGVDLAREADGAVDGSGHRGAKRTQPYRWIDPTDAINEARSRGYHIYGLSLDSGATALGNVTWTFPCALVLGSEAEGIPPEQLALCDQLVAIPLFGMMTSLNVAVAAGIVVNAAAMALSTQDPGFQPVRQASRDLLHLPNLSWGDSQTVD